MQMIKVQYGSGYNGIANGFKFKKGVQAPNLIDFPEISPVLITGFLKYIFIKGIKLDNEVLNYYILSYAIKPLWMLSKRERNQIIPIFMSNQKKYSLMFKQYQSYIKNNNKTLG